MASRGTIHFVHFKEPIKRTGNEKCPVLYRARFRCNVGDTWVSKANEDGSKGGKNMELFIKKTCKSLEVC